MGIIKTKGIILAEHNMGDYDKMVTLLTPDLGKIGCAAKGARRPKSLLMSGTQLLCFGDYVIYQGANSYNINSCETIEVFYPIRIDLDKLKYAAYITKIITDVTDENQNTYKILQLYLNTLYMISETDKNMDLVTSVFELRLMSILGFTPQVRKCSICQKEESIQYFSMKHSGFACEDCGRMDKSSISILSGTYTAIQYIIMAPPKKLFSFSVSEESIQELKMITRLYMNEKLDHEYKLEDIF